MRGFSLVELSIVLVILGLLTGGILAGQSLIRAAELRSIGTDLARYHSAFLGFRDKYMNIPGDMQNAYKFFSTDTRCTTNTNVWKENANGCNGDGDGSINLYAGEGFKFWLHLNLATLIEGRYSGWFVDWGSGSPMDSVVPGTNIPKSRVKDTLFMAYNFSMSWREFTTGNISDTRNRLVYTDVAAAAFPTEEAWNIDTKFDDGKPGTGLVTSYASCAANGVTDTSTAVYNLSNKTVRCKGIDYLLN